MPDHRGTDSDDIIDQAASGLASDINIFGLAGNDVIRAFSANVIGGQGDDRIEFSQPYNWLTAAYWDSPAGVVVDLAAGTAEDGWGTRDTLLGATGASGSSHDDRLFGDDEDNWLAGNGGADLMDGRGGFDTGYLGSYQSYYTIVPSADGTRAVVTAAAEPNLRAEFSNVERLYFAADNFSVSVAELVTPAIKAGTLIADPAERWNAAQPMGTPVTVTYSFMSSTPDYGNGGGGTGFWTFDADQQGAVRSILSWLSGVTGISFTEVSDTQVSHGQMRFGIDQQADTTGYTFLPNQPGVGELAGDVWMDVETMRDVSAGGAGYAKLLHEIGHALGLRHPGNSSPGDQYADVLAPVDDGTWLSALSENNSSQGLQRDDFGSLDLIALRSMYGARATRTGDDTWTLDDSIGLAEHLLIDDGGFDVLDLSALTAGAHIDLRPAQPGSLGRTSDGSAARSNFTIADGTIIEAVKGTPIDDVVLGNSASNVISGNGGNDRIDGGAGTDVAVFAGPRAQYHVTAEPGNYGVGAANGTDGYVTLISIERIRFSDVELPLLYQRTALAPGPGNDSSFLFDPVYYLLANADLVSGATVDAARQDYFDVGAKMGRAPTSWFDATYYESKWADLTPLKLDDATLFEHFNLFGVWEGRSPGPMFDHFDGGRYLAENPDVGAYVDAHLPDFLGSQTNGSIAHYILFGAAEQRLAYDTVGTPIEMGYVL